MKNREQENWIIESRIDMNLIVRYWKISTPTNNPLMDLNIRSVLVCYVYARLNRWVFNLDLNWQSVSASRTVLDRFVQSLVAK